MYNSRSGEPGNEATCIVYGSYTASFPGLPRTGNETSSYIKSFGRLPERASTCALEKSKKESFVGTVLTYPSNALFLRIRGRGEEFP